MRKTGTKKSIKKNKFSLDNFGKVASSFGYERNTLGGVVEPSIHKEAYMNTTTTPAQFYSPELTPETWLLPKSRLEILKWVRVFFNLEPYIQSILVMHAQYPICDFTLQYKDKDTTDFFNRKLFNNPEFSWIDFLEQLSLSYWKFGEAIVWGDWNPVKGTWNNFVLIDPSLVDYQENPLTGKIVMELIPTTELKQIVATSLKEGRSDLPSEYIECVQENQQIPLDAEGTEPNYITGKKYSPPKAFMFVRKTDPGAVRGTPILQSLFKTLIYQDKIRLAQIAIADRFHLPLEIWSIGSYTGDPKTSLIPDDATLSEFRNLIQQATMQPPFSIYVPPYVKYEAVGVNGKLLSVYEDLGYVENQILVGLGVNKNLITGQGPSFSSAKQVSLYKLIKMYKIFREKLEAFIKRYILLPISRANDLKDEYGNYIIPDIVWSESLQPEQDKEIFDSLSKLWDKGIISTLTLMENFMKPLDYKLEQKRLTEERGTVFDKGNDRLGNKAKRDDLKTDLGKPSSSGDRATADGGGYEGSENDDKSYLEPPLSGGENIQEGPSEISESEVSEQQGEI